MIKLEHVNKYFNRHKKNEIHVINDTSLELEDNGLVALLGDSGCGKTTLLNTIGGLDRFSDGKIYVNGKRLSRFSCKTDKIRNLNIGYIFQDYNLIDDMSVFDNVAIALKIVGIKNKDEIKKRVDYVLEKVGMFRYRNRFAGMLSGGERQRVGIARAIVKDPNIIIADEPTGNLDSKNTLEVMNIIKAISKDRLVILVTHETELADFYASRIIRLEDGKVISDELNKHNNNLNYKLDNKLYLKDYKNHKEIKDGKLNINYYTNKEDDIKINIVVENNNIYIKVDNKKCELIDENSSIEMVNDNYKSINKSIYEEYNFDFDSIIDKSYKKRYSSIFNVFTSLKSGLNKILNYSLGKKLLLLGFVLSGAFILYAFSSIFGINNIKDEDFVTMNKNYLVISGKKDDIDGFNKLNDSEYTNYIIPGESKITLYSKFNDYYQSSHYEGNIGGSLFTSEILNEENLVCGSLPSDTYDIVIDKYIIDHIDDTFKSIGLIDYEDFIGREFNLPNMKTFKLVGIVDLNSPSIYMNKSLFINTLYISGNAYSLDETDNLSMYDYKLYEDNISLKKGSYPSNPYEVIIPYSYKDEFKIGKYIDYKVNDEKLKVVGYYESNNNLDKYLVSENTILYYLIGNTDKYSLYSNNEEELNNEFGEVFNIKNSYEYSKNEYIKNRKDYTKTIIIVSCVILAISLVEIYLMIRSSFLSRIKEIGIYRAIGVKRIDIFKLFMGEIICITTLTSVPGILICTYIIKEITSISYFSSLLMINTYIVLLSIVFIYVFNLVIGLLPVYGVIRKTPASILSRNDVQ